MNELIRINYDTEQPTVSARELHEGLEIGTRFNDWFPRMVEYGFYEGKDFYSKMSKTPESGGRHFTITGTRRPECLELSKMCVNGKIRKGGVRDDNDAGSKFLYHHRGMPETGVYLLHSVLLAGPQFGQMGSGRDKETD